MTARLKKTVALRRTVGGRVKAAVCLALLAAAAACTSYTEIPIETPIQPKLDVSAFQRIYIAGFIAGANEDVDANMETVRLLRSQLRNKGIMRVIDADTLDIHGQRIRLVGVDARRAAHRAADRAARPGCRRHLPVLPYDVVPRGARASPSSAREYR